MQTFFTAALALVMLFIAAYAQRQIPFFTKPGPRVAITRLLLLAVGITFGYLGAAGMEGLDALLMGMIGFGLVHLPAAIILFIKSRRGARRS